MTNPTATALAERTLGDLVVADERFAVVLAHFGLDFCCGGRQTLEAAARASHVPVDLVVSALEALAPDGAAPRGDLDRTDLDVLVRHIVDCHHAYVREIAPTIAAWLARLVDRHGSRHPELVEIQQTFDALAEELGIHMRKEEHLLFPAIVELAEAHRNHVRPQPTPFGTIENPIRVMEDDHETAGDLMHRTRDLSNGYTAPADGCATYRLCFAELARFEADLHRHVHLENHVLFPRAVALQHAFD